MPKGILDHDIWRRARNQVEGGRKRYKDKWAVVSHVYQQMGGKYHKADKEGEAVPTMTAKAIEAIQNMSKLTDADLMRTIMKADHGEDYTLEKGKNTPGKRDGTGLYKGSCQYKTKKKGKRKLAGKKCPAAAPVTRETKLKSTLQDANDIAKGIIGMASRGLRAAGRSTAKTVYGLSHKANLANMPVVGRSLRTVGRTAMRHPKLAGAASLATPALVAGAITAGGIAGANKVLNRKRNTTPEQV